MESMTKYCQYGIVAACAALFSIGVFVYCTGAALADPNNYTFTRLATVPGSGPGTDSFVDDFEPHSINAAGNVAFAADLKASGINIGEGVFASRSGHLLQIMSPGQPAPGGGTFLSSEAAGVLGLTPLNNAGDGAFIYFLQPFDPKKPAGLNTGLYRFSLRNPSPSAVVVPGVTPAPTGGQFAGVIFNTALDDQGDLVFGGVAPNLKQSGGPGFDNLGVGLFLADKHNRISKLIVPGDPAPGNKVFDDAWQGWPNSRGTVGFEAHVNGEECVNISSLLVCGSSLYKRLADGTIQSIAHQGDPAPGGGTFRIAFGAVVNDLDDLVFTGDLTPAPGAFEKLGYFFNARGQTTAIALPGDPMPGGGKFVTASQFPYAVRINNSRKIAFVARLDSSTNGAGVGDTGLYVFSAGDLQLVARSGTVIPGVGTIAQINNPLFASSNGPAFFSEPAVNESGQIFFQATLADQTTGVLIVASPGVSQSASH